MPVVFVAVNGWRAIRAVTAALSSTGPYPRNATDVVPVHELESPDPGGILTRMAITGNSKRSRCAGEMARLTRRKCRNVRDSADGAVEWLIRRWWGLRLLRRLDSAISTALYLCWRWSRQRVQEWQSVRSLPRRPESHLVR